MAGRPFTETGITIDHQTQEVRVDTTNRRLATRAVRCGFRELSTGATTPYRRFTGLPAQISLRKVRTGKGASPGRSSKFGRRIASRTQVPDKKTGVR